MITYTRQNVLIISFIITVVIFIIINSLYNLTVNAYSLKYDKSNIKVEKEEALIDTKSLWQLEIPKINLVAPIAEGIDLQTMNKYIGHFPTTSLFEGNIGLAAHNRRFSKKLF